MKTPDILRHIAIDDFSATPKYQQLADALLQAIGEGKIKQNDILPSINELSYKLDISRDTAEKSLKLLKARGILGSVPGKGYFVQQTGLRQQFKILLLFNKLSEHKKIIYDAFAGKLGDAASIDFYIYNSDFGLFKKLLQRNLSEYTHVVILPHFRERVEVEELLNDIPREKLLLLDKKLKGVTGGYGAVYENFRENIYEALEALRERLEHYQALTLIFPENTYYPDEIRDGFQQFCQDYAFPCRVVHDVAGGVRPGEVYINLRESDLVELIGKTRAQGLTPGQDAGIISYNETPLKPFILNGLTTISTDFQLMGELAAGMILDGVLSQMEVPFRVTPRASL